MFMGLRNWFQGMNSASLCSLAGRYDNPIPPRFLAPIDFLNIPALQGQPNWSDAVCSDKYFSVESSEISSPPPKKILNMNAWKGIFPLSDDMGGGVGGGGGGFRQIERPVRDSRHISPPLLDIGKTLFSPQPVTGTLQYWARIFKLLRSPRIYSKEYARQGINSASLCSLADRYDYPIPSRFLTPTDCLKSPALFSTARISWFLHHKVFLGNACALHSVKYSR